MSKALEPAIEKVKCGGIGADSVMKRRTSGSARCGCVLVCQEWKNGCGMAQHVVCHGGGGHAPQSQSIHKAWRHQTFACLLFKATLWQTNVFVSCADTNLNGLTTGMRHQFCQRPNVLDTALPLEPNKEKGVRRPRGVWSRRSEFLTLNGFLPRQTGT